MERLFAELARLVQETELLNDVTKPFTPDQQEQFELWLNKTRNILAKIYGPRSEQLTMFDQIHFSPNFYVTGMGAKEDNKWYRNGLTSARALLRSLLETDGAGLAPEPARQSHDRSTPAPKSFVSGSFEQAAEDVVDWFCELAEAVGFDVVWLKGFAEPRPPEEKVKEYLRSSACIIQILTADVEEKGKEKGWIGNEMAWSESIHGKGKQALFVEEGTRATGVGPQITEVVYFERTRLHEVAPKAVAYLLKLLANASGR